MALPESFLDELAARSDIVETVSRYVKLKRSGANYTGLCPFHSEKTPSFVVSPDKQIYHCFGCGAGGGVINFIMQHERLEFYDAVRRLCAEAHLEMPEEEGQAAYHKRMDRLRELNRDAARFYHELLLSGEGGTALEYFARRGLDRRIITRFGLGFSPDAWDRLIGAMTAKDYEKSDLLDAGLAVKNKTGGLYDRFRNRVMFPIIDTRGAVIGFGGRVLDDSLPKYLNSPDTPLFSKNRNLFALNLAKKSSSRRIILAEGYMDVIALHAVGFDTAVASLGTSLTSEQARLIGRYGDEAVIAYDSDDAGKTAATRAIEILKQVDIPVKVLTVPGAKDPDEYIKLHGAEGFRLLLERSENHIEYRLMNTAAAFDLNSDEGRVGYLKKAAALLAGIDSPIEREVYTIRAARTAGVGSEALANEVKRYMTALAKKKKTEEKRRDASPHTVFQAQAREVRHQNLKRGLAEEGIICLLMSEPELMPELPFAENGFTSPFLAKAFVYIRDKLTEGAAPTATGLSQTLTAQEMARMTEIMSRPVQSDKKRALRDYIGVIQMDNTRASTDKDPLLALRDMKGHKQKLGG